MALALMSVPTLVAIALGALGAGGLAWVGAFLSGAALGGLWFLKRRAPLILILAVVSSVFAPIPASAFLPDALLVLTNRVPTVALSALQNESSGSLMRVTAAQARAELIGVQTAPTSTNVKLDRRDCAVPLVAADWTRTKPVVAWLVCEGRPEACAPIWQSDTPTGKLRTEKAASSPAIAAAVKQHGLVTPAEVFTLHTSPSALLDAWVTLAAVLLVLVVLNGLVLALLSWV